MRLMTGFLVWIQMNARLLSSETKFDENLMRDRKRMRTLCQGETISWVVGFGAVGGIPIIGNLNCFKSIACGTKKTWYMKLMNLQERLGIYRNMWCKSLFGILINT